MSLVDFKFLGSQCTSFPVHSKTHFSSGPLPSVGVPARCNRKAIFFLPYGTTSFRQRGATKSYSSLSFLQVCFALPADFKSPATGTVVHSLVAREAIRDLEEGASYLHFQHASAAAIKGEIIRLGLAYNLASTHTSFLAIEKRTKTPSPVKQPKRVDVPQYQVSSLALRNLQSVIAGARENWRCSSSPSTRTTICG